MSRRLPVSALGNEKVNGRSHASSAEKRASASSRVSSAKVTGW